MALKEKADKYFGSINSMASRMSVDMQETKLAYEKLWETLPYDEQEEILNQTIIKPEVILKYPIIDDVKVEYRKEYAVKMVIDDNCTYRDEHSGPFSFRTNSQRDLSMFAKKIKENVMNRSNLSRSITTTPKQPENIIENSIYIDDNPGDLDEVDSTSLTHILPKTGLDLLDNW